MAETADILANRPEKLTERSGERVTVVLPDMAAGCSMAVILSVGGRKFDLRVLHEVPNARVVRARVASGERAVCVAVTLEHECSNAALLDALRAWAARHGWSVTLAPLTGPH